MAKQQDPRLRRHPSRYLQARGFAGQATGVEEKPKSKAGFPLMLFTFGLLAATIIYSPRK